MSTAWSCRNFTNFPLFLSKESSGYLFHSSELTANEKTYRRLAMVYGVEPYLVDRDTKVDELVQVICQRAMISGIVKEGDRVVLVTSGVLFDEAETTSYIRTWTVQS